MIHELLQLNQSKRIKLKHILDHQFFKVDLTEDSIDKSSLSGIGNSMMSSFGPASKKVIKFNTDSSGLFHEYERKLA